MCGLGANRLAYTSHGIKVASRVCLLTRYLRNLMVSGGTIEDTAIEFWVPLRHTNITSLVFESNRAGLQQSPSSSLRHCIGTSVLVLGPNSFASEPYSLVAWMISPQLFSRVSPLGFITGTLLDRPHSLHSTTVSIPSTNLVLLLLPRLVKAPDCCSACLRCLLNPLSSSSSPSISHLS